MIRLTLIAQEQTSGEPVTYDRAEAALKAACEAVRGLGFEVDGLKVEAIKGRWRL